MSLFIYSLTYLVRKKTKPCGKALTPVSNRFKKKKKITYQLDSNPKICIKAANMHNSRVPQRTMATKCSKRNMCNKEKNKLFSVGSWKKTLLIGLRIRKLWVGGNDSSYT